MSTVLQAEVRKRSEYMASNADPLWISRGTTDNGRTPSEAPAARWKLARPPDAVPDQAAASVRGGRVQSTKTVAPSRVGCLEQSSVPHRPSPRLRQGTGTLSPRRAKPTQKQPKASAAYASPQKTFTAQSRCEKAKAPDVSPAGRCPEVCFPKNSGA